jgi:hypothetical protein
MGSREGFLLRDRKEEALQNLMLEAAFAATQTGVKS